MHRLFVAVEPPVAIRDLLLGVMGGISGARWQTDDQLHLTVRFIGEVDRHRAADISAALDTIHAAPFELSLAGSGSFDRKGRADAVWAGVMPHDRITALNHKVEQALVRVGVPSETRTFLPHITLARLSRSAGPVTGFLATTLIASPPFTVDGFVLYESTLGQSGADYRIVERYRL
jgi:RNA 2',3'-cyclic 3'-phosphodiesterase